MAKFVHIFRTELQSSESLSILKGTLDSHPEIMRWHVDTEDIDKVLKVETDSLTEELIIALAKEKQIVCEVLPD